MLTWYFFDTSSSISFPIISRSSLTRLCTFKRTSKFKERDFWICCLNCYRFSSIFFTPKTLESMARPSPLFKSCVVFSYVFPKLHMKVFLIFSSIYSSVILYTKGRLLEWLLEFEPFVLFLLSSRDCFRILSIDYVI